MLLRKHPWRFLSASIVIIGLILFASNPLRWPDVAVHRWLLINVPVGSDLNHLQKIAAKKGWQVNGVWSGNQPHADWGGINGATVAWIYLGGYQGVLRADLDSFWAFDERGHLVDVHIRRMIDGP